GGRETGWGARTSRRRPAWIKVELDTSRKAVMTQCTSSTGAPSSRLRRGRASWTADPSKVVMKDMAVTGSRTPAHFFIVAPAARYGGAPRRPPHPVSLRSTGWGPPARRFLPPPRAALGADRLEHESLRAPP